MTSKRGAARRRPAKKTAAATAAATAKKAAAKSAAPPKKKPAARKPATPKPAVGAVLAGVNREIATLKKLDKDLANGALAATAQALAREIDNADNSSTSKATCARALADTLTALRAMAPKSRPKDGVDELHDRRVARRAGRAAT